MCTADGMAPNNQAANRYSAGIRDESSSYRELNASTRSTNVCLLKITGHGRTFRLSRLLNCPEVPHPSLLSTSVLPNSLVLSFFFSAY